MRKSTSLKLNRDKVHSVLEIAEILLRDRYGDRPKFELRRNLGIAADDKLHHQINLFVGPRAGLELRYQEDSTETEGILHVRDCGWLDYRIRAFAMFFGFAVAVCAFLFLMIDGLIWGRFIARSVAFVEPHFHFGTLILYAVVPALVIGVLVRCLLAPLSLLVRPFCHAANRAEGVESPAELIEHLRFQLRQNDAP